MVTGNGPGHEKYEKAEENMIMTKSINEGRGGDSVLSLQTWGPEFNFQSWACQCTFIIPKMVTQEGEPGGSVAH